MVVEEEEVVDLVTEGDSAEAVEEIEVATVTVEGEVVRPLGKFCFILNQGASYLLYFFSGIADVIDQGPISLYIPCPVRCTHFFLL